MACPHMSTCPLYPQFTFESNLNVWKLSYCEADFTRCVRYQLSNEGKPVPVTLLPNGTSLGKPRK